jgi:AI-2E family transporter
MSHQKHNNKITHPPDASRNPMSYTPGQVIGPRILGQAVGVHPIIAISALFVGGGLFGLLGALFAVPIAGIVQAWLQAPWSTWQVAHPEQFPAEHEVMQEGKGDGTNERT